MMQWSMRRFLLAPEICTTARRVIITGANSGIGYHTAAILARKDAEVVFACRDEQRGAGALTLLQRALPDARLQLQRLDFASLASVRAFASFNSRSAGRSTSSSTTRASWRRASASKRPTASNCSSAPMYSGISR
jgi:NAD(P)-dependent dehydrogenase (short-subunit alcohol dehydrogenase family)